jgi:uncharacterized RmlC-like cupin family protein
MLKHFQIFQLKQIPSEKFLMHPVELKDYINFDVKRIYFITKPTAPTGSHCHKIEEEFFIMVRGGCVAVIDRGHGLEEFSILGPTSALYVPNFVWHHFKDFSPDAILLALSSTNYDPTRSDYIEDYEEFKTVSPYYQQK